jgi:hypothetical protein
MSGATAKVTVVGSINADMRVGVERFPGPGETLAGGEATLTPGGKGANQAWIPILMIFGTVRNTGVAINRAIQRIIRPTRAP